VASAWITTRATKDGGKRYRVLYRVGGRESTPRYAGSFRTRRDALARKAWVTGELAAMRVPDLSKLAEPKAAPPFAEVAKRWQASRVDVRQSTIIQHRTALGRVSREFAHLAVDKIRPADVATLVAGLVGDDKARESIRKTLTAVAMVLDYAGVSPNPARDRVQVKLPRGEREEPQPPAADTVEAVAHRLAVPYLIGLTALDVSGRRVGELEAATVGDLDEERQAWLVRSAVSKTKASSWGVLSDDLVECAALVEVVLERLPAREDRDLKAALFAGVTQERLRTAIARACRDAGVPAFSPHDLRHRRISLLHRQGVDWARIGARVGQRNLAVTANIYSHVLLDPREVDWAALLGRAGAARREPQAGTTLT
jgi:integrase